MRYYDIEIAQGGVPVRRWTSYPNGVFDPGALNVEFDVLCAPFATPMGPSGILIEGVAIDDLFQANDFATTSTILTLKGGMRPGLPLNQGMPSGVLMIGNIWQAFGNWEGTDMRLDLVVTPSPFNINQTPSITLNWRKGMLLSTALSTVFSQLFPTNPQNIQIQPITLAHDEIAVVSTMEQLAQYVLSWTQTSSYPGVQIANINGTITAYDGSVPPKAIKLLFQDLIGQPTWIEPYTIQFKTVMRSDIQQGSLVEMPKNIASSPGFVKTNFESYPSYQKYLSLFQQQFVVQSVRHIGSFRSDDASQWCSVINANLYGQ
ncbi:hypothetical protein [Acidithiobacillus sp.]